MADCIFLNDAMGDTLYTMPSGLVALISGDSDGDGYSEYPVDQEVSGCQEPDACNYNDVATDNHPNLTGWHYVATIGSKYIFQTKSMSRADASSKASDYNGRLFRSLNPEEFALLRHRTNDAECWIGTPDTLDIGGVLWKKISSDAQSATTGSVYYTTMPDYAFPNSIDGGFEMETFLDQSPKEWAEISEYMLSVDSPTEEQAILDIMNAQGMQTAWLNLSDAGWTAHGEVRGLVQDSTEHTGYSNWTIEPDTFRLSPN